MVSWSGNPNVLVCERGSMFGYTDLVVDPRNLVLMRDAECPVTCDVTHSLQQPAGKPLEVLIPTGCMAAYLNLWLVWQFASLSVCGVVSIEGD